MPSYFFISNYKYKSSTNEDNRKHFCKNSAFKVFHLASENCRNRNITLQLPIYRICICEAQSLLLNEIIVRS